MFLCAALSRAMALPLNGYSEMREREKVPERAGGDPSRADGSPEDWPDWSDPEESDRKPNQPVQIQIRAAANSTEEPISTGKQEEEEEPWDDFEEEEVTSDQSPTTPLPTPREAAGSSQQSGPGKGSKALKLSAASRAAPLLPSRDTSWDTSWELTSETPTKASEPQAKAVSDTKPKSKGGGGGLGGLGEEFTIMVKKKPENDPELDFFADMEPDIKLSSTATSLLLPAAGLGNDAHSSATNTSPAVSDLLDMRVPANNLSLTAKFAAEDVSEVSCSL